MALDWTQEMERRLDEKMCGQLTCCGGERAAIFVIGEANIMMLHRQPCLARPSA